MGRRVFFIPPKPRHLPRNGEYLTMDEIVEHGLSMDESNYIQYYLDYKQHASDPDNWPEPERPFSETYVYID